LTTVVDRLAGRGLVERVRDGTDRRKVTIRLTALAGRLSGQVYGPLQEWSTRNLAGYAEDDITRFTDFVRRGREFQAEYADRLRGLPLSWD
jgi:DNA-binding MarR family transcriptional regulator